ARLRSADATPLLQMLAIALPDLSAVLATDTSADISVADGRIGFDKITGVLAGTPFSGDLARSGVPAQVTGHLHVERLGLPVLAALALGPMPPSGRDGGWPTSRLSPGLADVPASSVALEVGRFDLSDTSFGRDARLTLGLTPGTVSLDDVAMRLGDGNLSGHLMFRRDGASASVAGHAAFSGQKLAERPLSGTMSGQIDFTTTGQSFAALAGGLAGSGKLVMNNMSIAQADAGALTRIIEAADRGGLNIDEGEIQGRLAREFDKAGLALGDRAFDVAMATGVLRLEPQNNAGRGPFTLAFDLRNLSIEARLALAAPALPRDWAGPPPAATLIWQGKSGNLQRRVEAGPLLNAISARAIAREAARVDALEADIRERAAFNRRLKAQEFVRRRERELDDFLEQQRRADAQRLADEPPRPVVDEKQQAAKAEAERQRAAKIEAARVDAAKAEADPIGHLLESPSAEDPAKAERESRMRRASEILRRRVEEAGRNAPGPRSLLVPKPISPPSPLLDPSTAGRY
ncbi:MAG: AsmA family protein, partial [Hyphomicrobiales bacterium]|nr:AsmA family protein [Hyphomicrobiales bacterium]